MEQLDVIHCSLLDIQNEINELKDIIQNLKEEREKKKCSWENLKNISFKIYNNWILRSALPNGDVVK